VAGLRFIGAGSEPASREAGNEIPATEERRHHAAAVKHENLKIPQNKELCSVREDGEGYVRTK
jgi:hypothetical protein